MAEEFERLNIDGVDYEVREIYSKMGISFLRFVELLGRDFYCPTLSASPTSSTLTYTDTDGSTNHFAVGQLCRWAEGDNYRLATCTNITESVSSWYILPIKVSELVNDLAKVATSGSYNDLSDKPTIPNEVTESTVSGWGFTKNTGTYSKPSTGIPKTDLESAVQTSLGKADTALQSHQDISGKQDKGLIFTNLTASSWVEDSTYSDYPYRCELTCSGVSGTDYADVVFSLADAVSGNYAPICSTSTDAVTIWSAVNEVITIPTIIVTKL